MPIFGVFYIRRFWRNLREVHGVCTVDRENSLKIPKKHLKDNTNRTTFLKDMLSKLN